MYSYTLSLTSATDGVGGQHHAPATLRRDEIRYPLCRRLDGLQGWSGRMYKVSPPAGVQTLWLVVSGCADYVGPAALYVCMYIITKNVLCSRLM
jgi:hypothetical protein